MNWLPQTLARWFRSDTSHLNKESIVICGPIGVGKRTILRLIATDATLLPDQTGMNRKVYTTQIYPSITFKIWDHVCAPGMLFQPEWPDYLPRQPVALLLVLDVNDIALFRTIREGLNNMLGSQNLRSCPTLILLNKSDMAIGSDGFLTVERIQTDLNLVDLFAKGLKTYVLRTSMHDPENLSKGLTWLNKEIN